MFIHTDGRGRGSLTSPSYLVRNRTLDASGDYILDLESPEPAAATNAEVYSVISNFINNLENQEGLMFNGTPINKSEKEKIASALKIATAVTLSDINCDS